MFSELMPVLQNTTVTLTIARIDDQLLRVNLIPTHRKDKGNQAEKALATPLTVTATATELDQEFARQVLSFSSSYQRSAANISEIEEAHAAAVKAAEEGGKTGRQRKGSRNPRRRCPRLPRSRQSANLPVSRRSAAKDSHRLPQRHSPCLMRLPKTLEARQNRRTTASERMLPAQRLALKRPQ